MNYNHYPTNEEIRADAFSRSGIRSIHASAGNREHPTETAPAQPRGKIPASKKQAEEAQE